VTPPCNMENVEQNPPPQADIQAAGENAL